MTCVTTGRIAQPVFLVLSPDCAEGFKLCFDLFARKGGRPRPAYRFAAQNFQAGPGLGGDMQPLNIGCIPVQGTPGL